MFMQESRNLQESIISFQLLSEMVTRKMHVGLYNTDTLKPEKSGLQKTAKHLIFKLLNVGSFEAL